jgi:hypothetical protein
MFPGWPADAPDVYVDADGEHGWDDIVEDEDGDLADPMTYRELAYDLAAARGLSIAGFLSRQRLRHGDDEKMSPPWVDDEG